MSGRGVTPLSEIIVGDEDEAPVFLEPPCGWRGVTPYSEIIVGDEAPVFLEPPCGWNGVTSYSEFLVGDKFNGTSSLGLPFDFILGCDPFLS